jgi:hypothetical protein
MILNEHVKIREEKFGAVIFETLGEKVFITNETGKEILSLLQKGKAPTEIEIALRDSYGIMQGDGIRKDIEEFIAHLKNNRIIR